MGDTLDAVKLALKHRKAIANGQFYPFLPALSFALAADAIIDPILTIPVVGLTVALPKAIISIYLFIFLFGKGKWKVKLMVFFLSALDFIPVVGLLPMSTITVLYVYYRAKKKADQAKKELPKLEAQTNAERIHEYQRDQAAVMAAEAERAAEEERANRMAQDAANDAQYQQEAANEPVYRAPLRNIV